MGKTTAPTDADNATSHSPAGAGSSSEVPDYVLDALELPTLKRWTFQNQGDMIAGVLTWAGRVTIPKLNEPTETREAPAVVIHGSSIVGGEMTEHACYWELIGLSTVLARNLEKLAAMEPGTLVRIVYLGEMDSQTRGHNPYHDFEMATSVRPSLVNDNILVQSPQVTELAFVPTSETDNQEPF